MASFDLRVYFISVSRLLTAFDDICTSRLFYCTYSNGSWGSVQHFYNDSDFGPHRSGAYEITQSQYIQGVLHDGSDVNGLAITVMKPSVNIPILFYVPAGGNTYGYPIDDTNNFELIKPGGNELADNGFFFIGMQKVGSDLYVVGRRGSKVHSVYKSTDSGQTWIEKDVQANSSKICVYDIHPDKIYFCRTRAGGVTSDIDLIEFSFGTDVYNTAHNQVTVNWGNRSVGSLIGMRVLSNGDTIVFYNKYFASFPQQRIYMATLIGGVWTTDIAISTVRYHTTFHLEVDSDDTLHIFWYDQNSAGIPTHFQNYMTRTVDGTLSAITSSGVTSTFIHGDVAIQTQPLIVDGKIIATTVKGDVIVPFQDVRSNGLVSPTFTSTNITETGKFILTPLGYTTPSMLSYAGVVRTTATPPAASATYGLIV